MVEVWKDIPGYEGYYQISNNGIVKSLARVIYRSDNVRQTYKESIKKQTLGKRGYYFVTLCKHGVMKKLKVHRLLAILFIPNPYNKPHVNHIDGNKLNNDLENLEWCSNLENLIHAHQTGLTDNRGSKNGMSKLTENEVIEIRKLNGSMNQRDIANKFNVSQSAIYNILARKTWKHVK